MGVPCKGEYVPGFTVKSLLEGSSLEIPLGLFNGRTSVCVVLDHGISSEVALMAQGLFKLKGN